MSEQFLSISSLTEFQKFSAELVPETDLFIEFTSIGSNNSDKKLYECRLRSTNRVEKKIKASDIDKIVLVLLEAKKMIDNLGVKS